MCTKRWYTIKTSSRGEGIWLSTSQRKRFEDIPIYLNHSIFVLSMNKPCQTKRDLLTCTNSEDTDEHVKMPVLFCLPIMQWSPRRNLLQYPQRVIIYVYPNSSSHDIESDIHRAQFLSDATAVLFDFWRTFSLNTRSKNKNKIKPPFSCFIWTRHQQFDM